MSHDLLENRIRLRPDLAVRRERDGDGVCWIIEDRLNSSFYRFGEDEYTFVSYLDGRVTAAEALEQTVRARPDCSLNEGSARALCQWLVAADLVQRSGRTVAPTGLQQFQLVLGKLNPFFIRIPLCRPNRLLERLEPRTRWLFSPFVVVCCVVLILASLTRLAIHGDAFWRSTEGIFSAGRPLGLLVCWVLLKIIHETGHGLVCKRYGGYVRDAGIMLILFVPVAFIDVTSAWRFRSKWQRILTSAAGMYVELVVAALAALCWDADSQTPMNQWLANCVIMASVTTVLFNANPLMRFDGYYILSDWLALPNLYTRGVQYLRGVIRRIYFGTGPAPLAAQSASLFVKVYALASWLWRITVVFGLIVGAAAMFHGAGIVLAAFGVIAWCAVPVMRTVLFLIRGTPQERPRRWRFAVACAITAAGSATLCHVTPWPLASAAPAVVEYAPLTVVRATGAGFIREVRVANGDPVSAGDVLIVMQNEMLELEIEKLELELSQSKLRLRRYRNGEEMSEFKTEASYAHGLAKQLAEKRQQLERLTVPAPRSGRVLRRHLETAIGTYLHEGDEIVQIGDEASKELLISLSQADVEDHAAVLSVPVEADVPGGMTLVCPISKVSPRASTTPIHLSLCAVNGGPLPVQRRGDHNSELEFLKARFKAVAELTPEQSRQLRSGQQFPVFLDGIRPSVGSYLWRWTRHTWNKTFDPPT